MIILNSKRVKGNGIGATIDFPTINFYLESLPDGLSEGLWAIKHTYSNGISLISKYEDGFRIETHIFNAKIFINVDNYVTLYFLTKLREPKKNISDIKKLIADDKKLGDDFFTNLKTCKSCEFCYVQDEGYSNYTVTSSHTGCFAKDCELDDDYSSIDCEYFLEGDFWHLDVDGYNERPDEEWVKTTKRDIVLKKLLDKEKEV